MSVRVPVKPRVYSAESGERLPLEHEIRAWLTKGAHGAIRIAGPPGSGKTCALEYLAAVTPVDAKLRCLDGANQLSVEHAADHGLVAYTSLVEYNMRHLATYRLAPWGDDELVEYLLAVHKPCCAAMMAHVKGLRDRGLLLGIPELWTVVLDEMAADDAVTDVGTALRRFFEQRCRPARARDLVGEICLRRLTYYEAHLADVNRRALAAGLGADVQRLMRHRPVQIVLAADRVASHVRGRAACPYLRRQLARDFVSEIGQRVASSRRALGGLKRLAAGRQRGCQPMAVSILHAGNTGWRPRRGQVPSLNGAYLGRVTWPGVALTGADLIAADFERADLNRGNLRRARARQACFRGANLRGASLQSIRASGANFAGADLRDVFADWACLDDADLTHANLRCAMLKGVSLQRARLMEASFVGADLTRADLSAARIAQADFSNARLDLACLSRLDLRNVDLSGASLGGTDLTRCDLQEVQLAEADFECAKLAGADLTGSCLPEACFNDADLRETGLADIHWEGADLRHADLRGATFHAGSSRSGLLFTPIASEGTRTGFYTDEYGEQTFKAPEEIRKANLRGADLRGANIDGVDFYLVDLREALYDAEQQRHFRRCGAILESPA